MIDKKISIKSNSRNINSLIQICLKIFTESGVEIISWAELNKQLDLGFLNYSR